MAKKKIFLNTPARPQAYVMPDRPDDDLTDEEFEALSDAEQEAYIERKFGALVGEDGFNINSDSGDHLEGALDIDDLDTLTDIEKAAAPMIGQAEVADFLQHLSDEPIPVELEQRDVSSKATDELLIAVWAELKSWKRQPKPEVIAKAVGLSIARVRGEKGIKHPRDLAKEVQVRSQTFFRVLKIATEEIDRLGLAKGLRKNGNL